MENKEKEFINFGDYKEFFDGELTLNLELSYESGTAIIIASHDGFDSLDVVLKKGHRSVVIFDYSYELKLLKIEDSLRRSQIQVYRTPISHFAYVDMLDSTVSGVDDGEGKFEQVEIVELKQKLDYVEKQLTELAGLHKEELDYIKAAFQLLNKKLDGGTKTAWKQTAYSVAASIACTITPQYAEQIFTLSHSAFTHIANGVSLLSNKS
ncbi:hypothetical protein NRL14_17020 [Pseudoalteromonas sp. 20-92]|uniref:hypothetical protein n=1 Tax=unclassified Pseudoalteromonas TaxID=194690 RepID=UPI0002AAB9EA|nr:MULTISPECIES: hypothetical protein [unclassified Pseudoalteromonas]ALQ08116.1 hypothetical protein D172_008625 [Pseudoalteromonas sp. Bsw20308]MDQ2045407.1 hypothetical protein [Pseudoalteromonas sp. 20-92]